MSAPGADYAGALDFVQVPAGSFRPGPAAPARRLVDRVVIHITDGGPDYRNTVDRFQTGAEGKHTSVHYVVGQGGEVVQMVSEEDIAQHAGGANARSIGIEHCARSPGELGTADNGLPTTDAQRAASALLVADICDRRGIPRDRAHILGHVEADLERGAKPKHPDCPIGAPWPWDSYMGLVVVAPRSAPLPPAELVAVPPAPRKSGGGVLLVGAGIAWLARRSLFS